jgi:hypothetical protein
MQYLSRGVPTAAWAATIPKNTRSMRASTVEFLDVNARRAVVAIWQPNVSAKLPARSQKDTL